MELHNYMIYYRQNLISVSSMKCFSPTCMKRGQQHTSFLLFEQSLAHNQVCNNSTNSTLTRRHSLNTVRELFVTLHLQNLTPAMVWKILILSETRNNHYLTSSFTICRDYKISLKCFNSNFKHSVYKMTHFDAKQ